MSKKNANEWVDLWVSEWASERIKGQSNKGTKEWITE